MDKAEEDPPGHLLNESFMFRKPEQLTEECRVQEAAQLDARAEQEAEETGREKLHVAYQKYR